MRTTQCRTIGLGASAGKLDELKLIFDYRCSNNNP